MSIFERENSNSFAWLGQELRDIVSKVTILFERAKSIHLFFPLSLLIALELIAASFVAPARKVRIRLRPSTEFYVDYASISIYFTTFAHINHKSATTYGKD